MGHALLIGDNMIVSRAIENRLVAHGFDTFDRAWARHQAADLASHHRPDLIVVGDSIADGSPVELARKIAGSCAAPVLMVSRGRVMLERHTSSMTKAQGPFDLVQLDTALATLSGRRAEMQPCT